jgi:hypothetical protein
MRTIYFRKYQVNEGSCFYLVLNHIKKTVLLHCLKYGL